MINLHFLSVNVSIEIDIWAFISSSGVEPWKGPTVLYRHRIEVSPQQIVANRDADHINNQHRRQGQMQRWPRTACRTRSLPKNARWEVRNTEGSVAPTLETPSRTMTMAREKMVPLLCTYLNLSQSSHLLLIIIHPIKLLKSHGVYYLPFSSV